jgi:carbonic anhydrase
MQTEIYLPCSEEELHGAKESAQNGNSGPLRALCRKEVERFEVVLREHPAYRDGLVKIERLAVEGYLYQTLRGHLDETTSTDNISEEG